jgi:ABC-type transport system involved in cytochrome c biogenesis permease subunit
MVLGATTVPTALLIAGIVMRCIIRSRPPVSTLYESILFIAAVCVLLALFIEYVNRQRIALALAPAIGALGLFLANKYEMVEGRDTMPSLVAVLDTNFWLSTHVTTVTIGYAAGLLASAVAHVYLLGKLVGWRKNDNATYRSLARMTYGIICFGLLFSVVGTVLGGIWANYSWGRFWGWDPKENGALMIVLWELAILHSRLGGIIKNFGVCMAAVFGGIIVAFSWFGVNLLGVGLHSYGFTSGIARALLLFYIIESVVLALGAIAWWLRERTPPNEESIAPAK